MEEIDLRELFRIFWNKKIQIVLVVAIFAVIGVIYTISFVKPIYSASTTLLLVSSNNRTQGTGDMTTTATEVNLNSKLVSTYSEIIKSKSIVRQVISNLNLDMEEETLKKNIKVNSVKDTELIEITVTNEDKYIPEKVANEIANVFIDKIKKELYKIENVQVLDMAETPDKPSNINHKKDIAIFILLGLVVSAAYVFILNMLDTTVKTEEDIENICKLPVLASIPILEIDVQKNKKGGKR